MDSEDFTPPRNREHVLSGIWELGTVIAPVLEKALTKHYGSDWRGNKKLLETLKRDYVAAEFLEDASDCLFVITKHIQRPLLGKQAISLASSLLTARNSTSHQAGLDAISAFHTHDCLSKLFKIIGHRSPTVEMRRDMLHRLVAAQAKTNDTDPRDGASAGEIDNQRTSSASAPRPNFETTSQYKARHQTHPDSVASTGQNATHATAIHSVPPPFPDTATPIKKSIAGILIAVGATAIVSAGIGTLLWFLNGNSVEPRAPSSASSREVPQAQATVQPQKSRAAQGVSSNQNGPEFTAPTQAYDPVTVTVDEQWQRTASTIAGPVRLQAAGTLSLDYETSDGRSVIGPQGISVRALSNYPTTAFQRPPFASELVAPNENYAALLVRTCNVDACSDARALQGGTLIVCPPSDSWLEYRINHVAVVHQQNYAWYRGHHHMGSFIVRPTRVAQSDCESTVERLNTAETSFKLNVSSNSREGREQTADVGSRVVPSAPRRQNLLVNGDFAQSWDIGWLKEVADPSAGAFTIARSDGMVRLTLSGRNSGWIRQRVDLPSKSDLRGLMFEAGIRLAPRSVGMIGLPTFVETAVIVTLMDDTGSNKGEIFFSRFNSNIISAEEIPETARSSAKRCQITLDEGFTRIAEPLDELAKGCLAALKTDEIRSVSISGWLRTHGDASSAEVALSDVRLYYK